MSTRPPPTFCFRWDFVFFQMQLHSFPRPYCCLPLSNLYSLLFISFPFCPKYIYYFFSKRENGVERGPKLKRANLSRREQASVSCYIHQLTGSSSSVGSDLAHWPIQVRSKGLLSTYNFFFFFPTLFTHSCLAQAACGRLSGDLQSRHYVSQVRKKKKT